MFYLLVLIVNLLDIRVQANDLTEACASLIPYFVCFCFLNKCRTVSMDYVVDLSSFLCLDVSSVALFSRLRL